MTKRSGSKRRAVMRRGVPRHPVQNVSCQSEGPGRFLMINFHPRPGRLAETEDIAFGAGADRYAYVDLTKDGCVLGIELWNTRDVLELSDLGRRRTRSACCSARPMRAA